MTPATRTFAMFVATWTLVCVGLLLLLSGFFTSWNGRVVSVRDLDPEKPVAEVLLVTSDGARFERVWPREAIAGLDLDVQKRGLLPMELPDDLARSRKEPFSLTFTIQPEGGGTRTVATTGPRPLAMALLVFFVGIGIRNMVVAGNPLSLAGPDGRVTNHTAAPPEPPAASSEGGGGKRAKRAKKGPPPGKRRRGGGRRR